jgi:putative DNA primase/helicase
MEVPLIREVHISNIPIELTALNSWVCWTYCWAGKWTKVLSSPKTGYFAKVNDRSTWGTFAQACKRYQERKLAGIGIVLQKQDPFCAFDLDDCRNEGWAHELIKRLDSYTERSPSGQGYRIFIKGKLPNGRRRKDKLEVYDDRRYVTVTGDHVSTAPTSIQDRQSELDAIYAEWFPPQEPRLRPELPALDDWQLLSQMLLAPSGAKFLKLWQGDVSDYPSYSEAELALCSLAAQFTNSAEQIDSLYRRSKLFRARWDGKRGEHTYGEITLAKALGG